MKGHLRLVIDRAFVDIWQPLTDHSDCPPGVFGEIYSGLRRFLREPEPDYVREDDGTVRNYTVGLDEWAALAMNDSAIAEELLCALSIADFESESKALKAISSTFSVLCEISSELANSYFDLLKTFVDRYSLRYYVDNDARFWVSFSGLSTALFGQQRLFAEDNSHILQQLNAFEHALAECLPEPNEFRIKTTIQKQVNVLEAFGLRQNLESVDSLGKMLNKVANWPHSGLDEAARGLNSFVNDFPGIRHAGSPNSAIRTLDLRDLIGVTVSLIGLAAYLAEGFDAQVGPALQGDLLPIGVGSGAVAPWLVVLEDCEIPT